MTATRPIRQRREQRMVFGANTSTGDHGETPRRQTGRPLVVVSGLVSGDFTCSPDGIRICATALRGPIRG